MFRGWIPRFPGKGPEKEGEVDFLESDLPPGHPSEGGPPPLISAERQLGVLWSAKSGCTTVTKWFFYQAGLLEEAMNYSGERLVHQYRMAVYMKRPEYGEERRNLPRSGYKLVKVVRSPFRRAVSSFTHALGGYLDADMQEFLGRRFDEEHRYSFEEWVGFLEATGVAERRESGHLCNIHHRQQVIPMELSGEIRIDRIVRLESLDRDLPRVESDLGLLPSDLASFSRSRHHAQYDAEGGEFCGDVVWPRKKLAKFGKYRDFYDDELRERIARIYADDFAAYGYDTGSI